MPPMRMGTAMPDFSGATEWVNGVPEMAALKGHPVFVHFWAISCQICHDNMPQINAWRDAYAPQGLQVIAIHMPRQPSDMDVARVREDMTAMGLTEPCGIDNTHAVAEAFQNEYVPSYFLFTSEGTLIGRAAGYNGLKMIEPSLTRLMASTDTP